MLGPSTFLHSSSEFLSDPLTSPDVMTSQLTFPLCPLTEPTVTETMDMVNEALHSDGSSSSENFNNSPSSVMSCCTQKQSSMQRSASSHSLQKNEFHSHFTLILNDLIESDSSPVRRAFSTSDLDQGWRSGRGRSETPFPKDSTANDIIEGMSRTYRYSPEEKKERIERYRSKRNLRNFTKKIKYICRKTLADSRPRIRGRFARNEEIEKNIPRVEWNHQIGGEEDHEEDENWIKFIDSLSANLINP